MNKLILVSCIVVNSEKEILLLYKKKHNFYETPGGKVEEVDFSGRKNLDEEKKLYDFFTRTFGGGL